jgi:hypothetical protein
MDDINTTCSSSSDDQEKKTLSSSNQEEDEETNSSKEKHIKLHINMSSIPCISKHESASELEELGVIAYDQRSYEQEVLKQVDEAMKAHSSKSKEKPLPTKKKIEAIYSFPYSHQPELTKEAEVKSDDNEFRNSQQEIQKGDNNLEFSDEDNQKDDESEKDKDYIPSDEDEYSDQEVKHEVEEVEEVDDNTNGNNKRPIKQCTSLLKNLKKSSDDVASIRSKKIIDDGNDASYQRRIR